MALFDNSDPIMFADLINEGFKISLQGDDLKQIATFYFEKDGRIEDHQISYDLILAFGDRAYLENYICAKVRKKFGGGVTDAF